MTHTEAQIQKALALVKMPNPKIRTAFENQLRAGNPSAWFVVAHKRAHA